MCTQGIPSMLSRRLVAAVFLIGSAVGSAQLWEPPENETDGSPQLVLVHDTSVATTSSTSAGAPVASVMPGKSEATRTESALRSLEDMLQRHRIAGNLEGEAEALAAIASCYRALKQEQRALDNFQSALAIWREMGRDRDEATTIAHIGDVYREWGFPEEAIGFYGKALKIYSRISDREGEAITRNNIGVAYLTLKDKRKCFEYFHQALSLEIANQDRRERATTLTNLASAYAFFFAKDPKKAVDAFQQVLGKLAPLDDPAGEANVLEMMGVALARLNREEMAKLSFQRALALYHALGNAQGESAVSRNMRWLETPGPYRVHQVGAISRASPEPLLPTAARLKIIDVLSER